MCSSDLGHGRLGVLLRGPEEGLDLLRPLERRVRAAHASEEEIRICFPAPGSFCPRHQNLAGECTRTSFEDGESGVYELEYQVSRWVPDPDDLQPWNVQGWASFEPPAVWQDSDNWDTIQQTQTVAGERLAATLSRGYLSISRAELTAAVGQVHPMHPNWYKVGVRARNRAGLRSCQGPHEDCVGNSTKNGPWAAAEGIIVAIDVAPPWCYRSEEHTSELQSP